MEIPMLWKIIFTLSNCLLGLVIMALRFLFVQNRALEKELNEFRLHVAETYAKKQHLDEAITRIEQKLDKLIEKIYT